MTVRAHYWCRVLVVPFTAAIQGLARCERACPPVGSRIEEIASAAALAWPTKRGEGGRGMKTQTQITYPFPFSVVCRELIGKGRAAEEHINAYIVRRG